ncbi:MAG: hypothetical protein Q4E65_04975 [Clostridia bacterium]|nr:hypothetical protein [Clostridia bacterium]
MKRTTRSLSFLLALFLTFTLLLPSVAMAQRSGQQTLDAFLNETECDQFLVGTDSNSYQHAYSDFPSNYALSTEYLNKLLAVATFSEQLAVIKQVDAAWGGSCFGIASTMILNKISKDRGYMPPLNIAYFQPGAQKYFDLTKPVDNKPVLDMINYYMISQQTAPIKTQMNASGGYINLSKPGTPLDASKVQKNSEYLEQFVDKARTFIDNDQPALFCYYYMHAGMHAGHAVVLCDYFQPDPAKKDIVFKIYDENDRTDAINTGRPHFAYLEVKANGAGSYEARDDLVSIHYFDERLDDPDAPISHTQYYAYDLIGFSLVDIAAANQTLNIHGTPVPQQTAGEPEFVFTDISKSYDRYTIYSFAKKVGATSDGIMDTANLDYANAVGQFVLKPAYYTAPIPVNKDFPILTFYANMSNFRYSARGDQDPATLDLTLVHDIKGKIGEVENKLFDGYDIVTSCGAIDDKIDFSVSKENGNGDGSFASISGNTVGTVRFDANGRLRKIFTTGTDVAKNVDLLCGSYGNDVELDMFRLYGMSDFGFLELYDETDDPVAYDNSIVLHFDKFPDQLGFRFFKGAKVSQDELGITSDDRANDTWVKIGTEVGANGVVEVSVWSGSDDNGKPKFDIEPDCTTKLVERPQGGSSSGSGINARAGDYSQLGILEGADGTWTGSGDYKLCINAPLKDYISVSMDNVPVPQDGVSISEGSTIVTLKESYLATLTPGTHVLRVHFRNGYAQTTLTISRGGALHAAPMPPATGTDGGVRIFLACLGMTVFCIAQIRRRRQRRALGE